jgi:hypothetical protein
VDEVDSLIATVRREGYLWHQFRVDRHRPDVLAAVLWWPTCADVLVLIDDHESHAYRTPVGQGADVFAPELVYWLYGLSVDVGMVWVPRAAHPSTSRRARRPAPTPLIRAPTGLGVKGERYPKRTSRPDR